MMEEYKIITDYDNYSVSNFGNVRNNKTDRILKQSIDTHGYYKVSLCKDKKNKTCKVHRLVAEAFIQNPDNKRNVDHIDNNRLNNHVENLRWATIKENSQNAKLSSKNTSGFKGISWYEKINKWHARIMIDGKTKHLGYFDNIEDAKIARQDFANRIFGEFTNTCEKTLLSISMVIML